MYIFALMLALCVTFSYAAPVPDSVNIGNSLDSHETVSTGKAGFFGGNSGKIEDVNAASDNGFTGGSTIQGTLDIGNTQSVDIIGKTGQGEGFNGDGGDLEHVSVASGNYANGGNSWTPTDISIGDAKNVKQETKTGDGGWLGGNGGSASNITVASTNYVNLNTATRGQVGNANNGTISVVAGNGRAFGDGANSNGLTQSSSNSIN